MTKSTAAYRPPIAPVDTAEITRLVEELRAEALRSGALASSDVIRLTDPILEITDR